MTDEIRKQIDGLEVFWTGEIKAMEGMPSRFVLLSDVVDLVEKLTRWHKATKNNLPDIGQTVLVGLRSIENKSKDVTSHRVAFRRVDGTWNICALDRVVDWKPIK